jgi:hypothetical protein
MGQALTDQQEVDRTVADDLVREVDVATAHVPCLR